MKSSDPLVSVVMSVYNGQPYLKRAVQSILNQTFEDFEFVIINDGSEDNSKEDLERFTKEDERIRLVQQENRGLITSLNRGLDMARGKYIARMDADDISHPERLEKQVDFLDANPKVGIVGTWIEWIRSDGEPTALWRPPTDPDLIAWQLLFNTCVDHPTIVARKSLLEELGGYARWPTHAEDYELWTRAVRETQLANLPDTLLKHRHHEDSITTKKRKEQIQMVCRSAANLHQALLEGSSDKKIAHWLVWMETKGIDRAIEETGLRDFSRVQRYLRRLYTAYTRSLCSSRVNTSVRRSALARLDAIASVNGGSAVKKTAQKIKNRLMPPRFQVLPWVLVSVKEKIGLGK
ncbi:glycosyltransferase involved in cell wall biosynthesis [Salinibacter ruber]|uniref:glycosyltransferase family 2 protein n=1 Tax=Salinibacter ruber TaxID=146919 RepID=UPI00216A7EE5|nr:glycosyltransferase [Salinibacter ruber]MCS3700199.1 glycosyltransferase involved in cell wall biosynthesis [Salinibacter ruber]